MGWGFPCGVSHKQRHPFGGREPFVSQCGLLGVWERGDTGISPRVSG